MASNEYKSALDRITVNCLNPTTSPEGHRWWDVAIAPTDIDAEQVAQAVGFLQDQGLLLRHPRSQSWIQVLEERGEGSGAPDGCFPGANTSQDM